MKLALNALVEDWRLIGSDRDRVRVRASEDEGEQVEVWGTRQIYSSELVTQRNLG